jgi:hypothetical protein
LQWKAQTGVFPLAANTLYAGGQRVYKSHREPIGLVWTPISQVLQSPYQLTAVASSWTNENRVYAALGWPGSGYGAYMWRTLDGGATPWQPITSPDPNEFITAIAVDPTDDSVLYVTTGAISHPQPHYHIWRTTNATAADEVQWSHIGDSLTDAPYNDIAISPVNRDRVVVVNGAGEVYETTNATAVPPESVRWSAAGDFATLPNTNITAVALERGVDLTVSTYGRGIWRLPGSRDAPDLTPKLIRVMPSAPRAGDSTSFNTDLLNQGNVASSPGTVRWCLDPLNPPNCTNPNDGLLGFEFSPGTTINPGSFVTVWSVTWTATAGSHTIYFCADVYNGIGELNEANNCGSATFTVRRR